MIKKYTIRIVICLIAFSGYSQKVEEVFKKVAAMQTVPKPLSYTMNYLLYSDHDSKKIVENYKGIFHKSASNETYVKIKDTEMINSKKANLKISHGEKAIVVSDPLNNGATELDVQQIFSLCKVISFKDYKTYWEIQLEPKAYSNLSYSKIILNISKQYFLQKQVFYYNTAVNFSNNYRKSDVHYPRLEVVYEGYNRKPLEVSLFTIGKYYTVTANNTIVLSKAFKKYEVIDQRLTSNTIK